MYIALWVGDGYTGLIKLFLNSLIERIERWPVVASFYPRPYGDIDTAVTQFSHPDSRGGLIQHTTIRFKHMFNDRFSLLDVIVVTDAIE